MNDPLEHATVMEFAANGLIDQRREAPWGKPRFGGITGVIVSIESGRVYVTEKSSRSAPGARADLGAIGEVTITTQRLRLMRRVTLTGTASTCVVKMNPESASALHDALVTRRTEDRTSHDAASVVEAIDRFAALLSRSRGAA